MHQKKILVLTMLLLSALWLIPVARATSHVVLVTTGESQTAPGSSPIFIATAEPSLEPIPDGELFVIQPEAGAIITDSNGTTIKIPPGGLIDHNGNQPSGPVTLTMRSIDIETEDMTTVTGQVGNDNEFGGELGGVDNGTPVALESVGALAAQLTDAAGNRVRLAPGQSAEISVPVPSGANNISSVQLWQWNPTQQTWLNNGQAQQVNGRFVGQIPTISTWNFDVKRDDPACIHLTVGPDYLAENTPLMIRAVLRDPQRARDLTVTQDSNILYNLPPDSLVDFYLPADAEEPLTTVNTGALWGGVGLPESGEQCNGQLHLGEPASAEVRYVTTDGDDTDNRCASPETPCSSVQHALDVAKANDEIRVAGGTYSGVTIQSVPDRPTAQFRQVALISKTVTLRGGFTAADWETYDPINNETILDAGGAGRVLSIVGDIAPTVAGFTMKNGNANSLGGSAEGFNAGGIFYVDTASAWLYDNKFVESNSLAGFMHGGGGYLLGSTSVLSNNVIADNTISGLSTYGGGLYLHESPATLIDNTIENNRAIANNDNSGGGLYLYKSDARLIDNRIAGNTTTYDGGGLYLEESAVTATGNTIMDNVAERIFGGGIYIDSSRVLLASNAVRGNSADNGGGFYIASNSQVTLTANIIENNQAVDSSGLGGGGLYLTDSSGTLRDNLVRGNHSARGGGGMTLWNASATLNNTVIADNTIAAGVGAGVFASFGTYTFAHTTFARNSGSGGVQSGLDIGGGAIVSLINSIVADHAVGIINRGGSNATVDGVLWSGNATDISGSANLTNASSGDPQFAEDGYHLLASSPARNAGVASNIGTDIDGEARDQQPDLGVDEIVLALLHGDCNGDSNHDAGDITSLIQEIFDNDGDAAADVGGGTFPGHPTCDANDDVFINAGDITCTISQIFNGPDACEQP